MMTTQTRTITTAELITSDVNGFSVRLPNHIMSRRLSEQLAWHRAQTSTKPKGWVAHRRNFAAETVILRRYFGTPEAEIAALLRDKESQQILALAADPTLIAATLAKYAEVAQ